MYANPFLPEVCCILALALYVWCNHRSSENECMWLFNGREQNKRYYNILVDALEVIPEEEDLGVARDDIGTHSHRKFMESKCAGIVDGPSHTQVRVKEFFI